MIRLIKKNSLIQENIDNLEKLMNDCHNSFIGFSLSSLFKKIISKYFIYSCERDSHEVEHSSKAYISFFQHSSFSSKKGEHAYTSLMDFCEAGGASKSIFLSDKGSKTQEKWNSPASSNLFNINYS